MKHYVFMLLFIFSEAVFSQNIKIGSTIPVDSIPSINSETVLYRFTKLDHHFPDIVHVFIPQIDLNIEHHCSKDRCRAIISGGVYFSQDSLAKSLTNKIDSVSINAIHLLGDDGIYYEETNGNIKGSLDSKHDSFFLQQLIENFLIRMKYIHFLTVESTKGVNWSECYDFNSKK